MWRVLFSLRKSINELVGEMLSGGMVRELSSPWASPMVLIRKKNGELHFCVDYRRLNAVTRNDVFPLPHIDDVQDQLKGKRIFSTFRGGSRLLQKEGVVSHTQNPTL